MRVSIFSGGHVLCLGLALAAGIGAARADSFQVLYAFKGGSDSGNPQASMTEDSAGNLYGTANRASDVFKLAPDGTETILYTFDVRNGDGGGLIAPLIADAEGNLYGTTEYGGDGCPDGCGILFKVTSGGTESVLYSFQGGANDGLYPYGGLLADSSGNFYGVTEQGGGSGCSPSIGCGTVYKLASGGAETVLYAFCQQTNCTDGATPHGTLIADASGNLYGTTSVGGAYNEGTVFKVTPAGAETVVYSFAGGSDGAQPIAGVIADASGNLYGTTGNGGRGCGRGCGTVFKIAPDGTETVLYAFKGGKTDGSVPLSGVIADASGNLYGTAIYGGKCKKEHCGIVFKITPGGTETILHMFNITEGNEPVGGLIADSSGELYGTTSLGGDACADKQRGHNAGCGIVFKVAE